ncbi:hypothetical protein Skr01_41740 [Sphaerisporangium krabiense]|uniref:Polysaccharide chain length determinant N-terminal domain-containing protein n=1 Tax=Sphaerisporangium krabiense TaxID=763782 RepID=A0A7W8Z136_9ACTN|nr:hypothetical protein [Sphaerisporangium krabiense]MBB5625397.1 hypothetical protein [Sphaerisporangium krabiense]GII64089.1 hypothetical protein Skr01_41740 [Sphaerisporangium krabiense]
MDLLDSLRALLRRWPVTVTLLAVTLAATIGAYFAIPWQYESKATVVFLSSRKGSQPVGGNPWLAFDGSLTITAEVIARGMSDERTLKQLKDEGNTAEFTVGLAQDSRGPLLDITATGADPKVAQATMEALAKLSLERLTEVQQKSSILPDATIRAEMVTSSDKAELTAEKKIRMLVIIFAGGALVTIGVPLFLESLAQKRRRATQGDHVTGRTGPIPVVPAHQQRVPRSGAAPRPAGPAVPRNRPPARPPRPIEPPPESRGYDRRPGSSPPARQPGVAEPRDQKRPDTLGSANGGSSGRVEDLYVWTDENDAPRGDGRQGNGARPSRGVSTTPGRSLPPGTGPAAATDQFPMQGRRSARPAAGSKPAKRQGADGDADDEPYVVFDPTRPGR